MNIDIRIKNNFFRHPKTKKLEAELGKSAPLFLIKIWIFASEFYPDGVLKNVDDKFVENEVGWPENSDKSLIQTLENIGFIERYKGNIIIHDWQEHNSYASENNNRADKGRFSKLKQSLPIVANYMQSIGIISISKEYYQKISNAKNPLDTAKILFKNSRIDKEEITGQNTQGDPLGTLKSDPLGTPRVDFSSNTNTNTNTKTKNQLNIPPKSPQGENKEKDFEFGTDPVEAEFLRLRNCYNQYARQEAPFTGWKEFQKLKWDTSYPGIDSLCYDIMERSEKNFWNTGYVISLVRYLNEKVWLQKIVPKLSEDEIRRQKTREALLKIQQEGDDDAD